MVGFDTLKITKANETLLCLNNPGLRGRKFPACSSNEIDDTL